MSDQFDEALVNFFTEYQPPHEDSAKGDTTNFTKDLPRCTLRTEEGKGSTFYPPFSNLPASQCRLTSTGTYVDPEWNSELVNKVFDTDKYGSEIFVIDSRQDDGPVFGLIAQFDNWRGGEVVAELSDVQRAYDLKQRDLMDPRQESATQDIETKVQPLSARVIHKREDGTFNIATSKDKITMTSSFESQMYHTFSSWYQSAVEIDFGESYSQFGMQCQKIKGIGTWNHGWKQLEVHDEPDDKDTWLLNGFTEYTSQAGLLGWNGIIYHFTVTS